MDRDRGCGSMGAGPAGDSGADIVIVGGGVIGASIAFQLARRRAGRVLLLESQPQLAAGATGRSGALVRTHYTNEPEAALAWAALPWFEEWSDRVGGDCGFVRTGFLQLVGVADSDRLRRNVELHQRIGIETHIVRADELRRLQPQLSVTDDEIAAYEPRSGYADPVATTASLGDAAERQGAVVRRGTAVTGLRTTAGRVVGVETADGPIDAGTVVLANGCWSTPLLAAVGVEVPIELFRAQRIVVRRPASLRGVAQQLTIIDRRNGIYTRPDGAEGTLVGFSGWTDESARLTSPDHVEVQPGFPEQARDRLAMALPDYRDAEIISAASGPLDVTPDRACILGRPQGIDGLVLAVGMSGSGFKKAPAIGSCIAELIVDGHATTAPIEPFAPDRFANGRLIENNAYWIGGGSDSSRDALVH